MNLSLEVKENISKVDHSDKKGLNNLTKKLKALTETEKSTPRTNGNLKAPNIKINSSTPVAKRLRKHNIEQVDLDYPKVDDFLRSKGMLDSEKKKPVGPKRLKALDIENISKDLSNNRRNNLKNKSPAGNQKKLHCFFNKLPAETQGKTKKLLDKSINEKDHSDSCDLPTFKPLRKIPAGHKQSKQLVVNIENISKDDLLNNRSNCINQTSPATYQKKLDCYFNKLPQKTQGKSKKRHDKSIKKTDSSDSCDLPTFKSLRKSKMKKKDKESFIKYGVLIPSVDEILKDQMDLEKYKTQVGSFEQMCDKSFELPFSVKDLKTNPVVDKIVLDCKELSLEDISEQFVSNLDYISDIFHGRVYNERHDRYHSISNNVPTLTTRDLTYNTSMILFTFDQKEHMLSLLEKEFDPNGDKTQYFFKVLLPELCLKIFIDTHLMSREEAVLYLDERPVVGD